MCLAQERAPWSLWAVAQLLHAPRANLRGRPGRCRCQGGGVGVDSAQGWDEGHGLCSPLCGVQATGPGDREAPALRAPRIVSPTFSAVGPAQSPCPTRGAHLHTDAYVYLAHEDTHAHWHMRSHTCARAHSVTCAQMNARGQSAHVHLRTLASLALPSSGLNAGEPGCTGRRASPAVRPHQGRSYSGARPQFPSVEGGMGWLQRASWGSRRGELETGLPPGPPAQLVLLQLFSLSFPPPSEIWGHPRSG